VSKKKIRIVGIIAAAALIVYFVYTVAWVIAHEPSDDSKRVDTPGVAYIKQFKTTEKLQHLYTTLNKYRDPVSLFIYDGHVSIIETRIEMAGAGKMGTGTMGAASMQDILTVGYGDVSATYNVYYDEFDMGDVAVNVKDAGPWAPAERLRLMFDGDSVKKSWMNDTVAWYFFKGDQFAISCDSVPALGIYTESKPSGPLQPALPDSREILFKKEGRSLFIFFATIGSGKEDLPEDLLYNLIAL
jgi:hypothetical protein